MKLNYQKGDVERLPDNDNSLRTGPMGNCVSVVVLSNPDGNGRYSDVVGWHGWGGLHKIDFAKLMAGVPNNPTTRVLILPGTGGNSGSNAELIAQLKSYAPQATYEHKQPNLEFRVDRQGHLEELSEQIKEERSEEAKARSQLLQAAYQYARKLGQESIVDLAQTVSSWDEYKNMGEENAFQRLLAEGKINPGPSFLLNACNKGVDDGRFDLNTDEELLAQFKEGFWDGFEKGIREGVNKTFRPPMLFDLESTLDSWGDFQMPTMAMPLQGMNLLNLMPSELSSSNPVTNDDAQSNQSTVTPTNQMTPEDTNASTPTEQATASSPRGNVSSNHYRTPLGLNTPTATLTSPKASPNTLRRSNSLRRSSSGKFK
jgi:hypothetical protein